MDKKQKIIDYIKEIYRPVAIVLAGSRASKSFSPTSDWDFYVFTDMEFKWGFDSFEDEIIDVSIEKYPVSTDFIFNTRYHPEKFLEIVFDATSEGLVKAAVERTQKKYSKGPGILTESEYRRLKKVMGRYIQKVESRKDMTGLAFYYLGVYYEIALRLWFQSQEKWPLSPHESIQYIKDNDLGFYKLLDIISTSKDVEAQIKAAWSIQSLLFKE